MRHVAAQLDDAACEALRLPLEVERRAAVALDESAKVFELLHDGDGRALAVWEDDCRVELYRLAVRICFALASRAGVVVGGDRLLQGRCQVDTDVVGPVACTSGVARRAMLAPAVAQLPLVCGWISRVRAVAAADVLD